MAVDRITWTEAEWEKLAMALHLAYPDHDFYNSDKLEGMQTQYVLEAMKKSIAKKRWRDVDSWKARRFILAAYERLKVRKAAELSAPAPTPVAVEQPAEESMPAADTPARESHISHRVIWTSAEWYAVAAELHRQNPFANFPLSTTLAGLHLADIKRAQQVLPEARRRHNFVTLTTFKPNLLEAFKLVKQDLALELQRKKEEVPPPAPAPQAAIAPVDHEEVPVVVEPAMPNTIDALVTQLGIRLADTFATAFISTFTNKFKEAFQTTIPAAMGMAAPALLQEPAALPVERSAPSPSTVIKSIRPPHILVVGPLPAQGAELERNYPQVKFSILKDDASNLKALASSCDRIIGMTSFMSHATDGKLKKHGGERYARVTGGVSAIKHLLDVWIAEGIVPPKTQLAA